MNNFWGKTSPLIKKESKVPIFCELEMRAISFLALLIGVLWFRDCFVHLESRYIHDASWKCTFIRCTFFDPNVREHYVKLPSCCKAKLTSAPRPLKCKPSLFIMAIPRFHKFILVIYFKQLNKVRLVGKVLVWTVQALRNEHFCRPETGMFRGSTLEWPYSLVIDHLPAKLASNSRARGSGDA